MGIHDIPGIEKLSTAEKILLVEDLWDSITRDEAQVLVPASHVAELEQRLKNFEAAPGNLLTFKELQQKINSRK